MEKKEGYENKVYRMTKEDIKEKIREILGDEDERKEFTKSKLKKLLEIMMNYVMDSERKSFTDKTGDVGNGFYSRNLQTSMGKLNLDVPRTRLYNFRPSLLSQPYKRTDESYDELLIALIQNGYSPNNLRNTLRKLNLNYSPKEIDIITDELKKLYYDFIQKELPEDMFAIYIDGYRVEMKDKKTGKVKTVTIYTVIGITLDWKKTLIGFYVESGVENKQGWLKVLSDLIGRGLRRVSIMISDDFSGLREAIEELFPYTDHQLCLVHFQRNIARNMAKEDSKRFKEVFNQVKINKSFEEGLSLFEGLILEFKERYRSFMAQVWLKRKEYLTFLKYPEGIRRYIYTTNISENFHRRLEWFRQNMGGFFQSEEILGINIIIQLERLKEGKWNMPNPHFKHYEYELLQIHKLKFKDDERLKDELKKALEEMATASIEHKKTENLKLDK